MAYLIFDNEMTPFDGEDFVSSYNDVAYVYDNMDAAKEAVKEWVIDSSDSRVVKFYEITPTSARLVGSYLIESTVTLTECED